MKVNSTSWIGGAGTFKNRLILMASTLIGSTATSCTDRFIVVSDSCIYHPKSGAVISYQYDSAMHYFEHLRLPKKVIKELRKKGDIR